MFKRQQQLIDVWWSTSCPARYRDLDLEIRRRKPPELGLSRRLLHELIDAQAGHENLQHTTVDFIMRTPHQNVFVGWTQHQPTLSVAKGKPARCAVLEILCQYNYLRINFLVTTVSESLRNLQG